MPLDADGPDDNPLVAPFVLAVVLFAAVGFVRLLMWLVQQ